MPRLDNGSQDIIMHFSLGFDFDDPGNNQPLDFCLDCWKKEIVKNDFDFLVTDHPPYETNEYQCYRCYAVLKETDNENF